MSCILTQVSVKEVYTIYVCQKLTSGLCVSWYLNFSSKEKNNQTVNSS